MKIHSHSFTAPSDHPQGARLARTDATFGRERLVLVDYYRPGSFDFRPRRAGREVYRIEDGLEIHVGYLSPDAEERFKLDLQAWLGASKRKISSWQGTPIPLDTSRTFRAC